MRQHHALRLARAAGGVEERRHVGVAGSLRGLRSRGEQLGPVQHHRVPQAGGGRVVDGDNRDQAVEVLRHLAHEVRETGRGGHQHLRARVAEDMRDLRGLEQRVDWYGDPSGVHGRVESDDFFVSLWQPHGDAVAAVHPKRHQARCSGLDRPGELAIGQRRSAIRDRGGVRPRRSGRREHFVQQVHSVHSRAAYGVVQRIS